MANSRKIASGVVGILLGILVIAFPFLSIFAASVLLGLSVFLIGIALLGFGLAEWGSSKAAGVALSIIGIVVLIAGLGLSGNMMAFTILVRYSLYLIGLILLISGVAHLFSVGRFAKAAGILGVIAGIGYIVVGSLASNPMALAVLIGLWLILTGATKLL